MEGHQPRAEGPETLGGRDEPQIRPAHDPWGILLWQRFRIRSVTSPRFFWTLVALGDGWILDWAQVRLEPARGARLQFPHGVLGKAEDNKSRNVPLGAHCWVGAAGRQQACIAAGWYSGGQTVSRYGFPDGSATGACWCAAQASR